MTNDNPLRQDSEAAQRFFWTLNIVYREARHLIYSWQTLFERESPVDMDWIRSLEDSPDEAIKLEAFVSRFGRMQDTIADKLIPRWLQSLAERTGSQIENLNRSERLGVLESTEQWLAARKLRNQLIHEYMEDADEFLASLQSARDMTQLLIATYNNLRRYPIDHLNIDENKLPPKVSWNSQVH